MIGLAVKLLIAHILGDFVLQPDNWVKEKRKNTYRSKYFYLHGLVHLIALLILLKFQWDYWFSITIIVLSHLLIDFLKLKLETKLNPRILFFLDQILHVIIIGIVVYINRPFKIEVDKIYSTENLLLILAILSITFASSILMKIVMSSWTFEENKVEDSLENAGKYIGILERLFVFGFIILNQWSAIGLLITAKSVFRFSDLSRAKDRKLTEYILIGTLLSFGLAIVIALLYVYLIDQI